MGKGKLENWRKHPYVSIGYEQVIESRAIIRLKVEEAKFREQHPVYCLLEVLPDYKKHEIQHLKNPEQCPDHAYIIELPSGSLADEWQAECSPQFCGELSSTRKCSHGQIGIGGVEPPPYWEYGKGWITGCNPFQIEFTDELQILNFILDKNSNTMVPNPRHWPTLDNGS